MSVFLPVSGWVQACRMGARVKVERPAGFWRTFGEWWLRCLRSGRLGGEQGPLAQVAGAGAAVHLSFEHLDAVDMAFYGA